MSRTICIASVALLLCASVNAQTQNASAPIQPAAASDRGWLDPRLSPEVRARAALAAMTLDEKLRLVFGYSDQAYTDLAKVPDDIVSADLKTYVVTHQVKGSAGFVPGVPRLGIPDQTQTDASIGVRNSLIPSTALPSSLGTAASFDPAVPRAGGAMIGAEARATGHNTMLSGGVNLAREPRNGRNFEYTGEDPLLAGTMAGALIDGIQSNRIVSTVKHYAVNDQETLRTSLDVTISAEAMRQSDLLAFEFAIEKGRPGSVMCSYNLINGRWGCENDYLLNKVLKHDWGFKGFVMSDWGAVHSTADAANDGLDQFTGFCCVGDKPWFGPLAMKAALQSGAIPQARLDNMVERILWALFAKGVVDDPVKPSPIDFAAHAAVAQQAAENSLVLLKNDGDLLPLHRVRSIAVVGGNADKGVMAGGGSSDVTPVGGATMINTRTYLPSPPLAALKRELPRTQILFDAGSDPASAAALAARSDAAIVFVTQYDSEGFDGRLELEGNQDAVVSAVAKANPRTIVVVESGGAVFMPWLSQVPAVLEAFYPGIRGGDAIARILTGKVNPSGHLPITFPASADQLAHPLAGLGLPNDAPAQISYDEGAAIGYKWYDAKGYQPLFAFGHGLSYTKFVLSGLTSQADGRTIRVGFSIRNLGKRAGKDVAQVYVAPVDWKKAGWEGPKRLGAFAKIDLGPGKSTIIKLTVDPRLLATYEAAGNNWHVRSGDYRVMIGEASDAQMQSVTVSLPDIVWSASTSAD